MNIFSELLDSLLEKCRCVIWNIWAAPTTKHNVANPIAVRIYIESALKNNSNNDIQVVIFCSFFFKLEKISRTRSSKVSRLEYYFHYHFSMQILCRFSWRWDWQHYIFFSRSDSRLNIYDDDIIILSGKWAGPTIPLPFPIKKTSQLHIFIHFSLPPSLHLLIWLIQVITEFFHQQHHILLYTDIRIMI